MDGPSPRNVARLDHFARPYIFACMSRGIQVDLGHFARMEKVLTQDMDRLTEEVRQAAGHHVNLDSGDQVAHLLFKEMGLRQAHPKLTPSQSRESVESEVLVAIQHEHPIVSKILDFKELSKLKGTYVAPMPKLARKVGAQWRMFPRLNDTRIPSGRLNCKEPNLLAMPNRTARGRQICNGFITDPEWVFVSVDESQIEPRIVAHRSQDESLHRVYHNEEDLYSDFAIKAFALPDRRYQDVEGWHYPGVDKKLHRFPAKTCTLAAIYDVTNKGLLEQMPVICRTCSQSASECVCETFLSRWTEDTCQDLLNSFYDARPGILPMRLEDHRRARKYGYLWDEFGRILHVQAVRSSLPWVVSSALREAGNFPIQSTAQATVKLVQAMVEDDRRTFGLSALVHPILQVHDELLFECHTSIAEEWGHHVASRFESVVELIVPLKAGMAMAETWGALVK